MTGVDSGPAAALVVAEDWGVTTTTLVLAVVTLLTVKMWQSYRYLATLKRMGIPGPTPLPVFGNTLRMRTLTFRETFLKWNKQYGKVYGAFLPQPCLVVCDLDLIPEIMVKKFSSICDRTDLFLMAEDKDLQHNLQSLQAHQWKPLRQKLSPAFSTNKLKQMMPALHRVAGTLRTCLTQKAAQGQQVELKDVCRRVTNDVMAGLAFGLHVDSVLGREDSFTRHVTSLNACFGTRFPFFMAFPILGNILRWCGFTPFPQSDVRYLMSVIDMALAERLHDTQPHGDLLQLFVEGQKVTRGQGQVHADMDFTPCPPTACKREGLTLSELHGNAVLFLFGGIDTTAMAIALTLFSLAAHPTCLHTAQQELDDVIGQGPVTYDATKKLTYLDMCINEAMRLHFPHFLLERLVSEDVEVGGHHLTKGWRVIIPLAALHIDPDIWPDPETFDPQRFSAEARAARSPHAFLPFGLGPRNCIAMRLAQLEVKVMLATVLQWITPVFCPKSVYPPRWKPMADARDGMWVKLEPRELNC